MDKKMNRGKAVLVFDMPESCFNCVLVYDGEYSEYCGSNGVDIYEYKRKKTKPYWCPLRELPDEENEADIYDDFDNGYDCGWNAFRGTILGEYDNEMVD